MNRPLRVLLAEDNPLDAQLVLLQLRDAGIDATWERVDSEAAYLSKLHNGWDIILSDYEMPSFGGIRALELLKASGLDIPFILISGTIGEEDAVVAMKLGASDYLLKDRIARLGTAIEHALEAKRLRSESKRAAEELRQTHEQIRNLLEHSPAIYYSLKIDGDQAIPVVVSSNIEQMLGITIAESLEEGWWLKSIHPDDLERALAVFTSGMKHGSYTSEYRVRHKNGTYLWVMDKARFVADAEGKTKEALGVWTDITERKLAEEALHESEARLRLSVAASNVGLWDWNLVSDEVFFSPEWKSQLGYADHEIANRFEEWSSRTQPDDLIRARAQLKRFIEFPDAKYAVEFRMRHKDGSWRWIFTQARIFRNTEGHPLRILGCHIDITERKLAEQLVKDTARFAALNGDVGLALTEDIALRPMLQQCAAALVKHLDAAFARIWTLNDATATLELQASAGLYTQLDGPQARVPVGQFKIGLIAGEQKPHFTNSIQDDPLIPEHEWAQREGLVAFAGYPLIIDHKLLGVLALFTRHPLTDITLDFLPTIVNAVSLGIQRKQDEARAEWLATFPERNPNPIIEVDLATGKVNYANPQAIALFPTILELGASHPSLSGLKVAGETLSASKKGVIIREIAVGDSVYLKTIQYIPETHRLRVYWSDITARKHAELALRKSQEQLNQSQKMDAIGQLAGGVAHDFNNQLNVIMGYGAMLAKQMTDPKLMRYANNIMLSGQRSADLTKKLLAFSRKGQFQMVPMGIHAILHETVEMLERTIDKRITIHVALNAESDVISGDPSQIQNAFLNLAVNARDAMPTGGVIEISTENVYLNSAALDQPICEAVPGDYLKICIRDTGTGMTDDVKRHLFEPFFTTKGVGKGTGMGLASVFGTVSNHKGMINVSSEVGSGTEFVIHLPTVEQKSHVEADDLGQTKIIRKLRILLVEDEEILRRMFVEMLKQGEHTIVEAQNGRKAVEIYQAEWQNFDLVILDIIMPEQNGIDAFRAMKKINPSIKALISTGFSLNTEVQGVLDEGVLGYIQKPFLPNDILKLITKVMNGS